VLIHSPLVGPSTWRPVAEQLNRQGIPAVVPVLTDSEYSGKPYWQQYAESVASGVRDVSEDEPLILVGHSGAGPLLAAIHKECSRYAVAGYIFADAGIPKDNASHLDLIRAEGGEWAEDFERMLRNGGRFPDWTDDDLRDIVPDTQARKQLL